MAKRKTPHDSPINAGGASALPRRCEFEGRAAAQAIDRLRLLEAEISYSLAKSRPLTTLDPQRINRLIELVKQPDLSPRNT